MFELQRSFNAAPTTLDKVARTVEVTAVSGYAPGKRNAPILEGARSAWWEEIDPAAVSTGDMIGMPVLRDHRPTTDSAIGTVTAARLEGGALVASIRFDGSAGADELMGKVEAGSVKGVSVGYRVSAYTKAGSRDGLPVYRATKWQPHEISFTPLPFDKGATVRSQKDQVMTDNVAANAGETNVVAVEGGAVINRAQTNAEIRSIAKAAGLSGAWADAHIDNETAIDAVRTAALDELKKRSAVNVNTQTIQVGVSHDDPVMTRAAMADALAHRMAPSVVKMDDNSRARDFAGWDTASMGAELLRLRGVQVNSRNRVALAEELLTRSHSTSDFPLLLEAAANKVLQPAYQAAAPTFTRWAVQKSFNDFKDHKFLRLGDFPAMQEVTAEGGEVRFGTLSEHREVVKAKEWATGISITRRTLINDDLGALGDFTSMAGARAAYDQNAYMYSLLQSQSGGGPNLADGDPVFHANHANLATSAASIDATSVNAGVIALGAMTTLDGLKMNLRPRFILCGPAKEMAARQLLAAITPTTTSNVNIWAGQFELIVDSNIVGNAWYLVCDPSFAPVFVHGYVNGGQTSPTVKAEQDFDTLGIKMRVGMDWGAGAIDSRGMYRNAGA